MRSKNKYVKQPVVDYSTSKREHDWRGACGAAVPFLFGPLIATSFALSIDGADTVDYRSHLETYVEVSQAFNRDTQIYNKIAQSFHKEVKNDQYQRAMNEIRKAILSSKALANNWDGYGAIPVGVQSAMKAMTLLDYLSPAAIKEMYDCFPEPNGTISMQWKNIYSERVSVNIGAERMSYYVKYDGEDTEYCNSIVIDKESGTILSQKIESLICA